MKLFPRQPAAKLLQLAKKEATRILVRDAVRDGLAKTLIGTCSRTGSGKRLPTTTHRLAMRIAHADQVTEVIVEEADVTAPVAIGLAVIALRPIGVQVRIDLARKNDLAVKKRLKPKNNHVANREAGRQNVRPLNNRHLRVIPLVVAADRGETTVLVMIAVETTNAAKVSDVTNHVQLPPHRRLPFQAVMISVLESLKKRRSQNPGRPLRSRSQCARPLRKVRELPTPL